MDDMEMSDFMFKGIYKNKKVLITGNTGFKGSWLTIWLLKLGAKVYGLSKDIPTVPSIFETLALKKKIFYYEEDIRDLKSVIKIIKKIKPDFMFHLAAQAIVSKSYADPIETISTNVLGTSHILEALKISNHPCNAVIITSDKCYYNEEWEWGYRETDSLGGKDIYSGSKGAAELIIRAYIHSYFRCDLSRIKIASARAGNVIGGGDWARDRVVPDGIRAWNKSLPVIIRNPNATRPWQHVLEPLSGYLHLGQMLIKNKNLNGESFNFGPMSINNQTVKNLIIDLAKYWNFKDLLKVYKIQNQSKFHEAKLLKLNCDKASFYLKWQPTLDYSKLIEFTSKWYYHFYKSKQNMLDFTYSQIKEYGNIAKEKGLSWAS